MGSISGDSMSIGGMGLVPSFGPPGVDCDAGWLMAFPGSSLQMFPQSGDLPKSKTSMRVVFSGTGNQMTPILGHPQSSDF